MRRITTLRAPYFIVSVTVPGTELSGTWYVQRLPHSTQKCLGRPGPVSATGGVLRGAAKARVDSHDGHSSGASGLVAVDKNADIAIVQLANPPQGLKPLSLSAAAHQQQGDNVFAVGHPRGLSFSVTTGIVSAVR